jgi:hypothetical protein
MVRKEEWGGQVGWPSGVARWGWPARVGQLGVASWGWLAGGGQLGLVAVSLFHCLS